MLQVFNTFEAKEVDCESTEDVEGNNVITCYMEDITSIKEPDMTISNFDVAVQGLAFYDNPKIFFLPIYVVENFPNLKMYWANNCSLKVISYQNFKGLRKLTVLKLNANQIEKINSDTFNDFVNLEELDLSKKL